MKKILLFIIVFLGMFPTIHHAKLKFFNVVQVKAGGFADEDGDGGDDCDIDPGAPGCPCNDYGNNYTETPDGSDNCFSYTYWQNISWDCSGTYEDDGYYSTPLTSLTAASLSLSSYSGNVYDAVTLTANATSSGGCTLTYEFQEFDSVDGWIDIVSSPQKSTVYIIDQGDESPFRVIVKSSCGDVVTSDEEDFIAPHQTCGVNLVTLQLSQPSGKLGDQISLTANVEKTGDPIMQYSFQACYNNDGNWYDLAIGVSANTSPYTVNILNEIDFRVGVYFTCADGSSSQTVYSDPVSFVSAYCRSDFLTQAQSQMSTVWAQAVSAQNATADLEEYGFALNWQETQFAYVAETPVSAPCNADTIQIQATTIYPSGPISPILGQDYTVGNFHTHPTFRGCDPSISNVQGPSSIDLAVNFPCPAFVGAFNTYSVSGGNSGNYGEKNYPYGIDCCTYR